jgi:hypothetical protein
MNCEDTQLRPVGKLRFVMFAAVLLACVVVPWVLQFTVAWWAAFPSWIALAYLYHRLFVPKGSVRTALAFDLALASFVVLLIWNAIAFILMIFIWAPVG